MKIISVSELTQEIKQHLEARFNSLSVKGEISNLKIQSSGHIYFTLKDKDSQIAAVFFKGSTKSLSRLPKDGDQVIVSGEITVYPPRGSYQLLVREIKYQGIGELLTQLHERKNRFQALGYFSKERKKKLPLFPKTIGVVTSPTGAVIQDILHVLQRRASGFHLILYPVKVQGEGSKEEIAKAIEDFNRYQLADLLILGRGGGSLEDLWAFNEEIVVEAIFQSKIPIISAVGHETDFSLSDFVADVRAPTPSAAAEIATAEKSGQQLFLLQTKARLTEHLHHLISRIRSKLSSIQKNPYISSPYLLLAKRMQEIDDKKSQFILCIRSTIEQKKIKLAGLEKQKNALEPSKQIKNLQEKLGGMQKALENSLKQNFRIKKGGFSPVSLQKKLDTLLSSSLQKKKENLGKLISHLTSIDPKNLLSKGYCILFSENKDSVILSSKQLSVSQSLKILLSDGIITTKVENIIHEPTRNNRL